MSNENNINENVNEVGLVENEKGDVKIGTLWFNSDKGVVEGTFDIFNFINPSDEFLGYVQKSLDLLQEGLYREIMREVEEEKYEQRKAFVEEELKDLEEMKEQMEKELEGKEEIKNIDEGEI